MVPVAVAGPKGGPKINLDGAIPNSDDLVSLMVCLTGVGCSATSACQRLNVHL